MGIEIPKLVTHIARDGAVLFHGAAPTGALTDDARTAFTHLDAFTSFVDGRVPEALDQVRTGLRIVIDERLVDDAVGGNGSVELGRAGARFVSDPIDTPVVVGHELKHALEMGEGNYMSDELNADLVGLAYARATGALRASDDPWTVSMVGRNLRHPLHATVADLKAAMPTDTHVMAGPIGAAIARASDELGVATVDTITVEAALRDMPRTSDAVRSAIDDLIWSGRPHEQISRAVIDLSMDDHARALLGAAARLHPDSPNVANVLRRELATSGVPFR
ncbi:MAG: hypothetical protein JWL76_1055 [Thermoleophilia bacterium]|nr:hypothetical protein [Thermoleophilia bacterium]